MLGFFWRLPDGRVWSGDEAAWVDKAPAGHGAGVIESLGALGERLRFYGLPLGELANKLERIEALQAGYQPKLDELDRAYLSAQMDGDTDDMEEIALEKQNLRAAMAREIKNIQEEK